MIVGVLLQMLGQLIDPSGQDRDLDLGRTGIRIMQLISGDDGIFDFFLQHFSFTFLSDLPWPELRCRPVIGVHLSSVILTAKLLYNRFFKK